MDTKHTESFDLKTLEMGYRDLNSEAFGESSGLLDKKDESATFYSLPAGGTQNNPLREERIQVSDDHTGDTSLENITQIFHLVERGDYKAISNLSTSDKTYVCTVDSEGSTALHRAVSLACQDGEWDPDFYQCINVLMNCEQLNVNMPDKKGYTAIGLAVHHHHKTCAEFMLKHPSADRLYLDYYPGDREYTVREIIMQKYPDLQPLLPATRMESMGSSDRDIKLLAALQRDEYSTFEEIIRDLPNPNPWYGEPYHSSLLEIACQMEKREQFVELLLYKGIDPKIKNRVTGMPLIHATARSGNFEVLQLLLKKEGIDASLKDNEKRTVLHWLAGVSEGKPGDKETIEKCFSLLLESSSIRKDIDDRDSLGNTPLYIAVESGFRDRAKLLLSKGADVRVFESGSKILLSDSVSIVNEILDGCLQDNKKPLTSKDLQLKLNYQPFMNIVPRIAERGLHRKLLTHPVTSTFLNIKWRKIRFIFIIYMGLYVLFLFFLTTYVLLPKPYNTVNDGSVTSNITGPFSFNDSNITSGINDSNFTSQPNSSSLDFFRIVLMVSLSFLTLSEMHQLIVHRWVYVKSLENWLEILLIISTFISCSGVVESAELKLHSSAIALFLGWSALLLMSGRLPELSVQKEMLRTVCWTFLKFMACYATLLIGFALSFYILFKGSSAQGSAEMFANPPVSILKTIVMFTGEFDASNLSFDTLPYTSHVIFLLFVVLMSIVLLNLLNGLAVNDTGVIRKDAEILSLAARAKLISRIEALVNSLPEIMKPSVELTEEMFVIYPNRRNRIGSAAVRSLIHIISKKREQNEKDKSTENQEEWRMLQEKLSELQILQENLQKKLNSMLDEQRQI